jgi:hypothetical protein
MGWYYYHPKVMMQNKKRELFAPFISLLFALFFFLLETIFTGYKPSLGLVPSPTSTFTCINRASTIATSTSKLVFHNYLHSKYTILYIRCQEKLIKKKLPFLGAY